MKTKLLLPLFALVAFLGGCAVVLPHGITANESYLTHPDGYTVIGETEGSSTVTGILFFGMSGNAGYMAAIDNAKKKAGADGLINVVADIEYSNMIFFRTIKTTVRGLAIKKNP